MNFCTYFDKNYLNKGLVCYETLINQSPESILYILCCDDEVYNRMKNEKNVICFTLQDVEDYYPNLLTVKNKRQPKEYYATISPILPLYIFDKYNVDLLFYTDADMAFWSDPNEMVDVMGNYSLMVTDHGFEPPRASIRFNVGILGYRNDDNCKEFLYWWRDKCIEWCYWVTTSDGRCADQGWLNILHNEPNKFKNHFSCPHPGVNYGPWKLGKHFFSEKNNKKIIDGQFNLICFHYHEFNIINKNKYFPTGWKYTENEIKIIYNPYFKLIKEYL
jgi:hypothetical protein